MSLCRKRPWLGSRKIVVGSRRWRPRGQIPFGSEPEAALALIWRESTLDPGEQRLEGRIPLDRGLQRSGGRICRRTACGLVGVPFEVGYFRGEEFGLEIVEDGKRRDWRGEQSPRWRYGSSKLLSSEGFKVIFTSANKASFFALL